MSIDELIGAAHGQAVRHGFWVGRSPDGRTPEALALIHSEVSEALEDWRKDPKFPALDLDRDGKPIGFPSELADIIIRVCDLAGALDVDLEYAIERKLAHNESRAHLHGDVRTGDASI